MRRSAAFALAASDVFIAPDPFPTLKCTPPELFDFPLLAAGCGVM